LPETAAEAPARYVDLPGDARKRIQHIKRSIIFTTEGRLCRSEGAASNAGFAAAIADVEQFRTAQLEQLRQLFYEAFEETLHWTLPKLAGSHGAA